MMRRWRVEFVDWHGNVQPVLLCFTKWGAERARTKLARRLWNRSVYVRVEAEP